jgi:hypothetical protein
LRGEDTQEVLAVPSNQSFSVPVINALFLVVPILFIVVGLCSLFWPRMMWFLSEGWKYKNVEPSGCALVATRISGLLGLLLGIVFLITLWALAFGNVRTP